MSADLVSEGRAQRTLQLRHTSAADTPAYGPCVAIGGITPDNANTVIEAGADFIAVSGGVWAWPDGPEASVQQLYSLCQAYTPPPR